MAVLNFDDIPEQRIASDKKSKSGVISFDDIPKSTAAPEADTSQGRISKSFERGMEGLKSTGYGLAALGADVVGAEDFGTSMLGKYKQTQAKAQALASDVPTYKDIQGFGDAGKYAVDAIFENLPMFIPSLVSGGVGAAVARKGAEKLVADMVAKKMGEGFAKEAAEKAAAKMIAGRVAAGSAAGAYVPSFGMEAGSIYGDVVEETGKRGGIGAGAAVVGGAVAGALDLVANIPILGKVFGESAKEVTGSLIKRLGVEGTKQLLLEGGTEGLQTIIEQASVQAAGGNKPLNWDDVIDAAIKGGVSGGVVGAGTEAVFGGQQKQPTEEAAPKPLSTAIGEDVADPTKIGFKPVGSAIGIKDEEGNVRVATIDSVKNVDGVPFATFTYHDAANPALPGASGSGRVEDLLPSVVDTDVAPLVPPPEANAEAPPVDVEVMDEQATAAKKLAAKGPKPVVPGTMLDVTKLDDVRKLQEAADKAEADALKITARYGKKIPPEKQKEVDDIKQYAVEYRQQANALIEQYGAKEVELTPESIEAARVANAPPPMTFTPPKSLLETEAKAGQGVPQVTVPQQKYEPLKPLGPVPLSFKPKSLYQYLMEQGGIDPKSDHIEDVGGAGVFKGLYKSKGLSVREAVKRAETAGYLGPVKERGENQPYTTEDMDAFANAISKAKETFSNDVEGGGVNPRQAEINRRAELKSIFGNAGVKGEADETIQYREDLHTNFGVSIDETKKLNIFQLKEKREELFNQKEAQRVLAESQRLRKLAEAQLAAANAVSEKDIEEKIRARDEAEKRAAIQEEPSVLDVNLSQTPDITDTAPKQERFAQPIQASAPARMTVEEERAEAQEILDEALADFKIPERSAAASAEPRQYADALTTVELNGLEKILRKFDPKGRISLRLKEKIEALVNGKLESAEGKYLRNLIEVSLQAGDKVGVLHHEVIHALKDLGLFTGQEWSALTKAVLKDQALMDNVRARYKGVKGMNEEKLIEEAIADLHARWQDGRYKIGGIIRSALERISSFIKSFGNALRGAGFNSDPTVGSVFRDVSKGTIGMRDVRPEADPFGMYSVRETPFRKWFGNSKVVDKNGNPLVVYHHGSFNENDNIAPKGPMHFGSRDAARERSFGKRVDDAAMAVSAYQAEDGSWHWDDGNGLTSEEIGLPGYSSEDSAILYGRSEVVKNNENDDMTDESDLGDVTAAYLNIEKMKRVPDVGGANGEWDAEIEKAKREGFDGIVYKNKFEDKGSDSYIVFKPTQIKSVNNRGTWDDTDPNIMYSLSQPATPQQASATVNKVLQATGGSPTLASKTISRPVLYFATMQGVARHFPVIARFQHWIQARSERETALINEGEKPIDPMTQLDYKPRKQVEAVMEFARLTDTNVTPMNGRITAVMPQTYNGVLGRPGEVFMLDKEQTKVFMEMKKYFKGRWNQYGQAIASRWNYDSKGTTVVRVKEKAQNELAVGNEPFVEKTVEKWSELGIQSAIADAQAQGDNQRAKNFEYVLAIYADAKARENYVPFSRTGDEGFTVRNVNTGQVEYFEMVDTKNVWGGLTGSNTKKNEIITKKFAELQKKFSELDAKGDPLYEVTNGPVSKSDIEKLDISLIEKLLAVTNIADKKDRNSAMNNILDALKPVGIGKTEVKNAIREGLLDSVKKAQRAGFTKESKNTPGYSTNFLQSIIDYNRTSASVVSGIEYGQQTDEAYDATQSNKVPENIRKYAERVNEYLDSDERLIGQIKQYGFWANLWGSVSSALVNLSQTPTITATQIAGWGGVPAAGRTMKLSVDMLRALSFNRRQGITLDPKKIKFKSPEEGLAFMDAYNKGRINPTITQDLQGTAPDNLHIMSSKIGSDQSAKIQKIIWNIADIGSSAFYGAEQVNRATAWLAAYREAQRPGAIDKFKRMYANDARVGLIEKDFGLTPQNIADFFVNETQFIGGKIDRPELLRGAGGVVFQFKQYPMNYLRILKNNMTSAGPEGKIAGTMMLMALTAFGGLLGLPFADDLVDSYEYAMIKLRGIDPMIEQEMRDVLTGIGASSEWAEAATRGPARFLGVDVSKRIGQGEILPEANPLMNMPVFGATIGKIMEAQKRFSTDQPLGGAVALASMAVPKGPSDALRGMLQLPNEGYQTQRGDVKVQEPHLGQFAAKTMGFQPSEFASIQERDYFARRLKYRTKEAENKLSASLAAKLKNSIIARGKGDSEKADKLMREFVDRYQRAAINFGNPSVPMDEKVRPPSVSSIKNRAMLMMHPELVVKNARLLKRSALSDLYDPEED